MSYCKQFGKDKVCFVTKEDHAIPSTVVLPPPEPAPGLISPNGDINWSCPCLGGMATGPCGVEFRDAFSCFHYSNAEPKGSDCYDAFRQMQDCFTRYPTVYNKADTGTGGDDDDVYDAEPALEMPGLNALQEPEAAANDASAGAAGSVALQKSQN